MSSPDIDMIALLAEASTLCDLALKSLRAPSSQTPISASLPALDVLRTDFISLLSLIHLRSLSLSLALKPPITPAAVQKTLSQLKDDLGRFTNCALSVDDVIHGVEIRKQMRWGAEEVIECLQRMMAGFAKSVEQPAAVVDGEEPKRDLIPIGSLLSAIDRIKDTLPKDNRAAILKRWEVDGAALEDGVREAREMIEAGDKTERGEVHEDDAGGWDELGADMDDDVLEGADLERAKKIFPLLRLVGLLHRRILTHHLKFKHPQPLSDTHFSSLSSSSTLLTASSDELVSSLYLPQDVDTMRIRVSEMNECVKALKSPWAAWELETGISKLELNEGESSGASSETSRASTNKKWFEMCFQQIDKVVLDLRNGLLAT